VRKPAALLLCSLVAVGVACTPNEPAPTTLRVLASSELADMRPILDDLRRETGVDLEIDYRGSVDASNELVPGRYHHDLAWLSSDRYFQLKYEKSGNDDPPPLSTKIMTSPVVFGVRASVAAALRQNAPDPNLTWADIADGAAAGLVRFGMADPTHTNSGLSALVGVATAAAGTGGALRLADISCDRLQGFLSGQTLTANTTSRLVDTYVAHQDQADGLIANESVLLTLNASGKLREPLEIIHPEDGMMLSEYPMLLLNPARRAEYDKVVRWLRSERVQEKIMARTLRRPVDPDVPRDPRLDADIGNALYFPAQLEVVDKLLANYAPDAREPGHVIFLLDFSGSMKGDRIAALRATFDGLAGADKTTTGRFVRFYRGEQFTLIRFGGQVLAEQNLTIRGAPDVDAMRGFLAVEEFDDHTAVWSALDRGYQLAAGLGSPVTIVLMTDGKNNAGMSLEEFLQRYGALPPAVRAVHTYTIRFGEADPAELDRAAMATGGRMLDATATSLDEAFKETRGCR
jgi:Ca-activated chloride channel homolog